MGVKITFIGGGNMARHIINGLMNSKFASPQQIAVGTPRPETLESFVEKGIKVTSSNKAAIKDSDLILLAVKPHMIDTVLDELKDEIQLDQCIVSIAAGVQMKSLSAYVQDKQPIIRAMPNTPLSVGEGVTALYKNQYVTDEQCSLVEELFSSSGLVEWVDEALLDAVVGVAGSSPAYFFLMLEAMGDAGVKAGLKRDVAYRLSAQAMLGSAKLYLESNIHPGALKDQVCSPGGSTIEAVEALEKGGFRASVFDAVWSAYSRSKEINLESGENT